MAVVDDSEVIPPVGTIRPAGGEMKRLAYDKDWSVRATRLGAKAWTPEQIQCLYGNNE